MKRSKIAALVGTIMLLVAFIPILGQQQSRNVTFQVSLLEWYDLYISPTTITFTDVAPDISQAPPTRQLEANQNPVDVRAFAILLPTASLRLTATANSDFHNTIPATTVSWTATGSGYQDGQLQKGTAVTVGEWSGSILHWHTGQLNFFFYRDYASQEPGTYSITATFTLSKV